MRWSGLEYEEILRFALRSHGQVRWCVRGVEFVDVAPRYSLAILRG